MTPATNQNTLLGQGAYRYEVVHGWGRLPRGIRLGYTHGVVVDRHDRVYVHNQSKDSVIVFDRDGDYLTSWGAEFAGGAHGLYLSREGGGAEYLYLTDYVRRLVVKTTLDGRVLFRLGFPKEAGVYAREAQYKPTDACSVRGGVDRRRTFDKAAAHAVHAPRNVGGGIRRMNSYRHLGPFSDLVTAAQGSGPLFSHATPGKATAHLVRETLGFAPGPEKPDAVRVERRWERDGIVGEEISWSVGYGPRTFAWFLRPAGAAEPLPGVVALHDHGGFKYYGKEKIADGSDDPPPVLRSFREKSYGGRAFANALAREGFAVLVPDTFLWGSRRFPLEAMSDRERQIGKAAGAQAGGGGTPPEIAEYNASAAAHEHTVEKYCTVLGTTLAGVVSFEDRVAAQYLAARPEVKAGGVGCVGLSGGGARSALLQATCERIRAAVIVGMMSTYDGLLDHNIVTHTWMLFPHGWSRHGDWADLAACRAPSPLLVQYDRDDSLFTPAGMEAADRRIAGHYASVGAPRHYIGQFYPGPHKFDQEMQAAAFAWLAQHLRA